MGELKKELGFLGDSQSCTEILHGNYISPPSIDVYTEAFLKSLHKPSILINQLSASLSTPTFINKWKKIKESTSVGSSGVHFGHIKAYSFSQILADFEATIRHIPFTIRYSPKE